MSESTIHPQAVVSPEAKLGAGVTVGAFAVIGAHVTLGDGCVVHSHAVIQGPSKFGANNIFHPFSAVGVDPQDLTFKGERTELIVGERNNFRESVTVSRGTKRAAGRRRSAMTICLWRIRTSGTTAWLEATRFLRMRRRWRGTW